MNWTLTPEAQADRDDFEAEYGWDGNCSCHVSAPCGSCSHPGNPHAQDEDPSCWMLDTLDLDDMEREARAAVADTITRAAARHLAEIAEAWA